MPVIIDTGRVMSVISYVIVIVIVIVAGFIRDVRMMGSVFAVLATIIIIAITIIIDSICIMVLVRGHVNGCVSGQIIGCVII